MINLSKTAFISGFSFVSTAAFSSENLSSRATPKIFKTF